MLHPLLMTLPHRPHLHAQVMKTCTFYLIVVTVLVNGGFCGLLLDKLELRQLPLLPGQEAAEEGGLGPPEQGASEEASQAQLHPGEEDEACGLLIWPEADGAGEMVGDMCAH